MTLFAKTASGDGKKGNGTVYSVILADPDLPDLIKESVYSLLAVRYSDGTVVDYSFMFDVCRDGESALRILEILRKNEVYPCHLKDVVTDLL